jgi:hypothetical protein
MPKLHVLSKAFNADILLGVQIRQYSEKLLLAATVPAQSSITAKTTVSNLGHFLCLLLTGKYTTLQKITDPTIGVLTIDDGIQHLRAQLIDGAGQKKLFSDYIPLDLFLSPGRGKANASNAYLDVLDTSVSPAREVALAAAPGQTLFFPQEFEYLFSANSEILLDIKNDSLADNFFEIALSGYRILASASVRGVHGGI